MQILVIFELDFIWFCYKMATKMSSTKEAEVKQKIVWVPSEESKEKYKEDSAKALERMEQNQPTKKTIVKDRKTALRRSSRSIFSL